RGRGTGSAPRAAVRCAAPRVRSGWRPAHGSGFGRLVAADVLGGDDGGEVTTQLPIAAGETVPVHVGHDDQLVMPGQSGQRLGRIAERWPVRYRFAEPVRP